MFDLIFLCVEGIIPKKFMINPMLMLVVNISLAIFCRKVMRKINLELYAEQTRITFTGEDVG